MLTFWLREFFFFAFPGWHLEMFLGTLVCVQKMCFSIQLYFSILCETAIFFSWRNLMPLVPQEKRDGNKWATAQYQSKVLWLETSLPGYKAWQRRNRQISSVKSYTSESTLHFTSQLHLLSSLLQHSWVCLTQQEMWCIITAVSYWVNQSSFLKWLIYLIYFLF